MRPIKFRAWYSGRMIDVGEIEFFTDGTIHINSELVGAELMQFTGLLDKNGKEIYHSDYIKTPAGIGLVVWDKCYWIKWEGNGKTTLHDTLSEQMEVFGNEYEGQKT